MAKRNILVDVDLNQNEIQNPVLQNLATNPASGSKEGRFWMNTTTHKPMYYDGTNDQEFGRVYSEGNGIDITNDTISIDLATGTNAGNVTITTTNGLAASAPKANTSTAGLIEIATDTEASTGTDTSRAVTPKQLATKITANTAITGATKCKITYDSKGLVTSGADLQASDIPDISATYVKTDLLGANSGVATLGADGKVPSGQLPSFVDDVIDSYIVSGATALSAGWLSKTSGGSALTPETDKIYVIVETGAYLNKTYRWSGTTYVEISASPAQATESQAGIAEIATQAEVETATDDTKIVTPMKLAAFFGSYGVVTKESLNNTALTSTNGVCTWSFTNPFASSDVLVQVFDKATNTQVMTEIIAVDATITIKINSASNIPANTYKAVIIG